MSIMRKYLDKDAPPVVGAMCIVLTDALQVPLRAAYWCHGFWREPHTAQRLVPTVFAWCLMADAVDALERGDADLLAALEGLRNRGVLTAEQAEEAKRRIAAGGAA
jgi:hypothetical protein